MNSDHKELNHVGGLAMDAMVAITTIQQIIIELFHNSLDAKATNISVNIDCSTNCSIKVVDDGIGFSYSDLKIIGAHCCTDKTKSDLNIYGFKGRGNVYSHVLIISLKIIGRFM
jgi:hypothetical protein